MENLPFRKLQQMCKERNLSPCGGKGVKKDSLIALLKNSENKEKRDKSTSSSNNLYENLVKEHDPSFYSIIQPYVSTLPDFRPQETIAKMKKEEQDNWRLIYDELMALGYDETSQEILEALNEENLETIEDFIFKDEDKIKDFSFSYPALTWILHKAGNKKVIDPILVASGFHLKEVFSTSLSKYVRDEETAKKIVNIYPKLTIPMKKMSSRGDIYLLFYGNIKEFKKRSEFLLSKAIEIGDLIAVQFILDKANLSEDQILEVIYSSPNKLPSIKEEERRHYEELYLYLLDHYAVFKNIEEMIKFMEQLIRHHLNKVYFFVIEKDRFSSSSREWRDAFRPHTSIAIQVYNDTIMKFQLNHNRDLFYHYYVGFLTTAVQFDNINAFKEIISVGGYRLPLAHLISTAVLHKSKTVLKYIIDNFNLKNSLEKEVLVDAIQSNDREIVEWLLPYINPNHIDTLYSALQTKEDIRNLIFNDPRVILYPEEIFALLSRSLSNEKTVEFILSHAGYSKVLYPHLVLDHAVSEGNPDVVRLLLNDERITIFSDAVDTAVRSRLTDIKKGRRVVRCGSYNKNLEEILIILLSDPRIDPSVNQNEALKRAIGNNDIRMVEILLTNNKVREALTKDILDIPTDSIKIKNIIREALPQ